MLLLILPFCAWRSQSVSLANYYGLATSIYVTVCMNETRNGHRRSEIARLGWAAAFQRVRIGRFAINLHIVIATDILSAVDQRLPRLVFMIVIYSFSEASSYKQRCHAVLQDLIHQAYPAPFARQKRRKLRSRPPVSLQPSRQSSPSVYLST